MRRLDLVLGFFLQQLPLQIVVLISVSRQGKAGLGYPLSITLKLSFAEITLHLGIGGGRQESQHRWRGFRLACFDGCFDIYDVRFNRHDCPQILGAKPARSKTGVFPILPEPVLADLSSVECGSPDFVPALFEAVDATRDPKRDAHLRSKRRSR
jgi:hypothetical protein